jgi:hypothetical protein
MLSILELFQQKQGSCLVYTWEISECYILCITQDLEFMFCVPISNTILKSRLKQEYKISPESVSMPL